MKKMFLLLMVPFMLAMSEPPQQKMLKQTVVVEPTVDWTMVIVAGFGALGACVPAYFGYKGLQRRRAKREE